YRINPKAVWSDGVPITGADFVYNWQAQSGTGTDVGGHPFTPASRSGYDLIQSVAASPSSPDQVTVTFSSPYPDWSALFRHLIPVHVAQSVGFNSGFTDPLADLVSGGPYIVADFSPSGFLRLVRNPSYWGTPASTLELDFRFVPDMQQLATSLQQGQVSCAEVTPTAGILSPLKASKNLNVMVAPGPQFLDLEFRQSSGPLRDSTTRAAITNAVTRVAVVSASVGATDPGDPALANRFLVTGEAGYTPHGPPPPPQAPHGSVSPMKLGVDPSDPVASAAAETIAQELIAAGYSVSLVGPTAPWDLAVRDRTLSPFAGDPMATYLSSSATNVDGVSDPTLDALIDSAAAAQDGQRQTLIDQVDQQAWASYADLPLFALPPAVACQTDVVGIGPNPSPDGPAYDATSWGLLPGTP
ncbi:MAG TPA: ABC transporter substrate-binding protein, partial [Acidimicrobiales bacterium]|nr:ABC transporter substrate-binding protein [Acidimicrobiales bacterium]